MVLSFFPSFHPPFLPSSLLPFLPSSYVDQTQVLIPASHNLYHWAASPSQPWSFQCSLLHSFALSSVMNKTFRTLFATYTTVLMMGKAKNCGLREYQEDSVQTTHQCPRAATIEEHKQGHSNQQTSIYCLIVLEVRCAGSNCQRGRASPKTLRKNPILVVPSFPSPSPFSSCIIQGLSP